MLALLFILFAAIAIGSAIAVVAQRNPLYSAISLIGVFISLACLYVMLAAPFLAAVAFYAWTIIYIATPVLVGRLWLRNQRTDSRRAGPGRDRAIFAGDRGGSAGEDDVDAEGLEM